MTQDGSTERRQDNKATVTGSRTESPILPSVRRAGQDKTDRTRGAAGYSCEAERRFALERAWGG